MNASMARRIRRAESLLIYAIDRHAAEPLRGHTETSILL
jgi:hypothetical protein